MSQAHETGPEKSTHTDRGRVCWLVAAYASNNVHNFYRLWHSKDNKVLCRSILSENSTENASHDATHPASRTRRSS